MLLQNTDPALFHLEMDIGWAYAALGSVEKVQAELRRFTPIAGTSVRNPLDVTSVFEPEQFLITLRLAARPDSIHALFFHTGFDFGGRDDRRPDSDAIVETLARARDEIGKPLVVAIRPAITGPGLQQMAAFVDACARAEIALFPGVDRAARALAGLVRWHERRAELE